MFVPVKRAVVTVVTGTCRRWSNDDHSKQLERDMVQAYRFRRCSNPLLKQTLSPVDCLRYCALIRPTMLRVVSIHIYFSHIPCLYSLSRTSPRIHQTLLYLSLPWMSINPLCSDHPFVTFVCIHNSSFFVILRCRYVTFIWNRSIVYTSLGQELVSRDFKIKILYDESINLNKWKIFSKRKWKEFSYCLGNIMNSYFSLAAIKAFNSLTSLRVGGIKI